MGQKAEVRERAQQFIDALHSLEKTDGPGEAELDALVGLFADDARLTNAALRLTNEERRGTEAIRTFWADYKKTVGKAYSDFHQVTVNDHAAGLFWVTRGTANGDPDAIHYDGTTLLVFNDKGKIEFFQGYYDTHQLNRQLGVEPTHTATR
jgi:hypothetical protein